MTEPLAYLDEYNGEYFKKTRNSIGLLLKMQPLWKRWVKIIRKYKNAGLLLDIGCGEGYFLQNAERYYDTYGMDISEYCIQETTQRTTHTKLSVGSITCIDHLDEHFDIVTCFDVMEHIKNLEVAIQECRRVLKKGGLFVIRVPNTSSIGCKWKNENWFAYKDKTHVSLLSNEEWFEEFRKHNFEVLTVFYDGLWDSPYLNYIPKLLQDGFIKFPSIGLFLLGLNFSKKYGENLCILLRRR